TAGARGTRRRDHEHDIVRFERSPGAVEELLALQTDRGDPAPFAQLQPRLVHGGHVRAAAHEPVSTPATEPIGQALPRLLAEQEGELVREGVDLTTELIVVTYGGGQCGQDGHRGRVAHRVTSSGFLIDGAEDVL